jgi:hypothetical protein
MEEFASEGVTAFDGSESGPKPSVLCAATTHVYSVPFVSPPTLTDVVWPSVLALP